MCLYPRANCCAALCHAVPWPALGVHEQAVLRAAVLQELPQTSCIFMGVGCPGLFMTAQLTELIFIDFPQPYAVNRGGCGSVPLLKS